MAIDRFDSDIRKVAFPVQKCELKAYYKKALNEAMEEFRKKSIGGNTTGYMNELKRTLKDRYAKLKKENEKETKVLLIINGVETVSGVFELQVSHCKTEDCLQRIYELCRLR
eukprot:TRINITY_DN12573_c0_g1_i1.p1 TRINITY_DN12573_c0_g1~~TRINITY_DN12573_c0_g1_i1.p1  ORF type:complete len:112 (+),score=7.14 TRINITY_DN12573_c0_g1_i1:119-454(+)